jgi:peptidoglycan hydrolase-like protein with peptidoglycan-binding domain
LGWFLLSILLSPLLMLVLLVLLPNLKQQRVETAKPQQVSGKSSTGRVIGTIVAGVIAVSALNGMVAEDRVDEPDDKVTATSKVLVDDEDAKAIAVSRDGLRKVQAFLNKNGYEAGPEDGLMGAKTKAAILDWQKAAGQDQTGEVSNKLYSLADGQMPTEHKATARVAAAASTARPSTDAVASTNCKFLHSEASVTWQTPNGLPVVYAQYECGKYQFRNRYYDLDGREWPKHKLVPSSRHALNDVLEEITGKDFDINGDLDAEILNVAIKRGIVPAD